MKRVVNTAALGLDPYFLQVSANLRGIQRMVFVRVPQKVLHHKVGFHLLVRLAAMTRFKIVFCFSCHVKYLLTCCFAKIIPALLKNKILNACTTIWLPFASNT